MAHMEVKFAKAFGVHAVCSRRRLTRPRMQSNKVCERLLKSDVKYCFVIDIASIKQLSETFRTTKGQRCER